MTARTIATEYQLDAVDVVDVAEIRATITAEAAIVCTVVLEWRATDGPASVEVALWHADSAHRRRGLASAALAASLGAAHAAGAEYAVATIAANDLASAACLLRVGFEPELTGPGQDAAWERLLATESGRRRLL